MDGEGAPRGSRGRPRGRARGRARGTRGAAAAGRGASTAPASASASSSNDTDRADASVTPTKTDPDAAPSIATASASTSSAARSVTPTRGAARGGRGGRFLPRAIRRSALDREAIANQEISKVEDQEKQDARLKRALRGGRGGGRRARGGPVNFGAIIRGSGGGFGSGIQASTGGRSESCVPPRPTGILVLTKLPGGGSSGFGSTGGFGSAGGSGSGSGGGSGGDYIYRKGLKIESGSSQFNSSSRPTGPRMNTASFAEIIHENVDVDSKEKTPLLPMGIRRVEPKPVEAPPAAATPDGDGDPMVVSDNSSDIGDAFHNDLDQEMTDAGKKWPGVSENKRVKVEGEEISNIDHLTQRLAKQQLKFSKNKTRAHEDMDWEDRHHAEKMASQRLLFGIHSDDDEGGEGDNNNDADSRETKPKRVPLIQDGSLYIFQFPPVMPPLHVSRPAPGDADEKSPVKDEPADDDDVDMSDTPAHDPNKPVDLTNVKEEEDEEEVAGTGSARNRPKTSSTSMQDQPGGHLGQLLIRKSGKIQMNYGGMLFDVEMAMPISHLREAVLIVDQGGPPDADGYHGTAYGMGRIAGKFNAVPHWSDVKPWNVNPKELPPWGCDAAPEGTTLEDYAHLLAKK